MRKPDRCCRAQTVGYHARPGEPQRSSCPSSVTDETEHEAAVTPPPARRDGHLGQEMPNSDVRLADAVGIFLTLREWCPLRRRKPLPVGSDRRLPVRAPRGRTPRLGRSRASPRFQGEHAARAGSLGSAAWVDWLSGWRGGWGCGRDAGLGGGLIGGKGGTLL